MAFENFTKMDRALLSALNGSNRLILVVTEKGEILYCNRASKEGLGTAGKGENLGTYLDIKSNESNFLQFTEGGTFACDLLPEHSDGRRQFSFTSERIANSEFADKVVFLLAGEIKTTPSQSDIQIPTEFLRSAIEHSPSMVFLKDSKELRLRLINRRAEEIMGIDRENVIGKSDHDLFPKEQADFFTQKDREVLASGDRVIAEEEPIDTPEGRKWLKTIKAPLKSSTGTIEYLLGVSEDITELKNQKILLDQKEHRFKLAQNAAQVGTWFYDVETNLLDCSDQFHLLFSLSSPAKGIRLEHVLGKINTDDLKAGEVYFRENLNSSAKLSFDFRVASNTAKEKWLRVLGTRYFDSEGQLSSFSGTCQDITDKKKMEMEILKLNKLSTEIEEVAAIGGWELDVKSGKTKWTHGIYKIYGVPKDTDTSLNQGLSHYTAESKKKLMAYIDRAVQKHIGFEDDFEFIDGSNTRKWVRSLAKPILNEKNEVEKIFGTFQDVTESRRVYEQLIYTTEELNCFFDLSIDLLCIIDSDGFFKKVNPRFSEILGFSEEELQKNPFLHFVVPADRLATERTFAKLLTGESVINFENRYLAKSGEYRYLNWSGVLDSNSGCIYAAARDVSDIRASEQVLNSYSRGLDTYAIIARTDSTGKILEVNQNFCKLSGYSEEELLGKSHRVIKSGYHDQKFFEDMWNTIISGQQWRGEICNKAKDGSFYWVDTTITPLFNSDGKVKEFLSFRYDITEKKNTELRLREQKGHLDRLIANSPGMVYQFKLEVNGKMYFPFASQKVYEIFEITDEDYNANTAIMLEMIHPDDTERLGEAIAASARNMSRFEFEGRLITKSGKLKYFHARSAPTQFQDGSILWDGIIIDMSERKKLETELERRKQITNHQVRLASLGELAAGVGHEINNPLAIVKAVANLLLKRERTGNLKNEELVDSLRKIIISSDRIANIVKGLRTFSRKDDEEFHVFDIFLAVKESVDLVKEIFDKDQIALNFNYDRLTDSKVYGDKGRIQQVVMNLLSNARDALEGRAAKKIDVDLFSESKDVILTVKDNGTGVPEEIKAKIFDPFFTTKEVNKGTGLGLSLVFSIAQEHNGSVTLVSSGEHGSVFQLCLPISGFKEEFEPTQKQGEESSISFEPLLLAGKKILVVDDESGIREVLAEILQEAGAIIEQAENGRLAYDKLGDGVFDLVISDMKMPVMDGQELLQLVRKNEALKNLKFIFLTGGVNLNLEASELAGDIDGFILKPFDFDLVTTKIFDILHKKPVQKVA